MSVESVKGRVTGKPPEAPATTLYDRLMGLAPYIERAAPDGIAADRFLLDAYRVLRANPALAGCDWHTLSGALLTGAQLGLSFGPLQHAWLIPRKERGRQVATFQLGYKGLVELARRSGRVGAVRTGAIFDWSEVDEVEGTEPRLIVRPRRPRAEGAEPVGYWCVVELLDGSSDLFSVMERAEVEAAAAAIPGSDRAGSAWREHFDSMARIAVFRRMGGFLPLSVELAEALALDGSARTLDDVTGGPAAEPEAERRGVTAAVFEPTDDEPEAEPEAEAIEETTDDTDPEEGDR